MFVSAERASRQWGRRGFSSSKHVFALMGCVFHLKPHLRCWENMPNPGVFFRNSTCWVSCPFLSAPKGRLIPAPTAFVCSLTGWSQTPVSPSLSPQELGQLPSLSWCWSNISLCVDVSRLWGGNVFSLLLLSSIALSPVFLLPVSRTGLGEK